MARRAEGADQCGGRDGKDHPKVLRIIEYSLS